MLALLAWPALGDGTGHGGPAGRPPGRGGGSPHRRGRRAGPGAVALQRRQGDRDRPPRRRAPISGRRARRIAPTTSVRMRKRRTSTTPAGRRSSRPRSRARRSNGRLAFNWYRTRITLPAKLGGFDVTGSTVVFELVVDDYAEIWVDGQLPLVLGQTGGQLIKGFNAPNRVVLTRDARPGQQFQLAVFGVNGPISSPPENFIWVRSATLDFYRPGQVGAPAATPAKVVRLDPALDRIVPTGRRDREARGRIPVHRGAGLASRRLPALQRPQRQHDLSLDAGGRGLGLPHAKRLHRRRHRRVPPARLQRAHPRPERPAHDQRARQQAGDPSGADRKHHGARRPVRGEAAQQPQRPGVSLRRHALLHRSAVRAAQGVRRSEEGAAVQRGLHGEGRPGDAADEGAERTQRHRLLAGRAVPVRRQLGPEAQGADALRGERRRHDRERARSSTTSPGSRSRWRSTASRWTSRATSTSRRRAACGSSRRRARRSGRIVPPEHDANFTFGDADGRSLYLTASTGLYRVRVNVPGIRPGAVRQAAAR